MNWLRRALGGGSRAGNTPAAAVLPTVAATDFRSRGNAALAQGQLARAADCYEQGLQADPTDASLRLNLGFVLLELGQPALAAERLHQALALRRPADDFLHEAHYLLGRAQDALGQPDLALASFEFASRARADFAEPLHAALDLLHRLKRHGQAVATARRLVQLQSGPDHWLLLARELVAMGEHAEALELLTKTCAQEPGSVDASVLRFQALMKLRLCGEALAEAQRLLSLAGRQAGVLVNVATALEGLGRSDEALAILDEALQVQPGYVEALVNRSAILLSAGRQRECIAAATEGLKAQPDHPGLHWNRGFAHLLLGEFAQGWPEHEWRFRQFPDTVMDLDLPRWRGQSLAGRSIFLYGEQGFGDNLQFVRYLALVASQAATVYLLVPEELERLMTALPSNCRLLAQGARLPHVDYECPLMSVPAVLGTTEPTIPAQVPYLRADPARVSDWRERLPKDRLNVGIAWSGKVTYAHDHLRSMTLDTFRAVAAPGCRFITVQPQLREHDRAVLSQWTEVHDFGRELRDFADTAALMEALDLVVTTDTSVAHLAGALARPVWILLSRTPDWRWMLEREDSPWYPTARLYRQDASRSWAPVLARVQADLCALARQAP